MADYLSVVADLQARRNEIERRIGAMRGEQKTIDNALAVIAPLVSDLSTDAPRTDRIVAYVTEAGKWLTHSEIVRGLCPGSGLTFGRERHVIRTQIGQLVKRGDLGQHEMLIGLPGWDAPSFLTTGPQPVSARNGRSANIRRVLAEIGGPLHIKEVCAEMLRRGFDADERCVAACLQIGANAKRPKWRKVGAATYQIAASEAKRIDVPELVGAV